VPDSAADPSLETGPASSTAPARVEADTNADPSTGLAEQPVDAAAWAADERRRAGEPVVVLEGLTKTYFKPDGSVLVEALRGVDLVIRRGEYVAIMGASGSGKSTLMNLLGCLDRPTSGRYCLADRDVSTLSDEDLSRIRGSEIGFVFQAFNLISALTVRDNLDSSTGEAILGLFETLHRRGLTIIMVTHDDSVADRCERVVRLHDGELESDRVIRRSGVLAETDSPVESARA